MKKANKQTEEELGQLTLFCKIASTIASTLEIEKVLGLITRSVCQLINTHACTLRLINEEGNELTLVSSHGLSLEYQKKGPVMIGEGIAGCVLKTGKPEAVLDVLKDPRYKTKNFAKKASLRSLLCVPLVTKERTIGVISTYTTRRHSFSEKEQKILSLFASEAAIAIENARLMNKIKEAYLNTLRSLGAIVDAFDWHTERHSENVRNYSIAIGREMGLEPDDLKAIEYAAYIHDIGKVGIDLNIIRKPDKLNEEEWRQIIKHPLLGANIAERMEVLDNLVPLVLHHHERFDGKGYPDGLKSEGIPIGARILAVADSYEAMTADRPYRKALSKESAVLEIKKNSGIQFDPKVVGAFLKTVKNFSKRGSEGQEITDPQKP